MPRPGKSIDNKARSRHQDAWDEQMAERREKREVGDLQAAARSLQEELDEVERGQGGAPAPLQLDAVSEKEQIKQLQRQLKDERKHVAELEAEIAEQVIARERSEMELARLEGEEKGVEAEREVKSLEEQVRGRQGELRVVDEKIRILEGTLDALRRREAAAGLNAESSQKTAEEGGESEEARERDYASQKEVVRIKGETEAEERKAEVLEARLKALEGAAAKEKDAASRATFHPPASSASDAHRASFAVQRLLKTVSSGNQAVDQLRRENTALLMQLGGVSV